MLGMGKKRRSGSDAQASGRRHGHGRGVVSSCSRLSRPLPRLRPWASTRRCGRDRHDHGVPARREHGRSERRLGTGRLGYAGRGGGSAKSFSGIVPDGTGSTDTGYGSGLTKDTYDVPNWTWIKGTVTPNKSNIAHTYAAAYPDGILYFGQDKPASSGVNAVGFWFFQNKVGLDSGDQRRQLRRNAQRRRPAHHERFHERRQHVDHQHLQVAGWCARAAVDELDARASSAGASSGSLIACMISNQTAFTAQWPPNPPGFAVDQFSFVEGGIDLAEIYGSVERSPASRASSPTPAPRPRRAPT